MALRESSGQGLSLKSPDVGGATDLGPAVSGDDRIIIDASKYGWPRCRTPRPGDRVAWYAGSIFRTGELLGHTWEGKPVVRRDDEIVPDFLGSYDVIRLENMHKAVGPNWSGSDLNFPSFVPNKMDHAALESLLAQKVAPGPRHEDLIHEIYARGYEVFIIGGAVRDAICQAQINDLDLVTTMPINLFFEVLVSMYDLRERAPQEINRQQGYYRLGSPPGSRDPYIDVTVFPLMDRGTSTAIFTSSFAKDVAHRDFSINCLYYDHINNIIHDPSSRGLTDCEARLLKLVAGPQVLDGPFKAKLVIRAAKFTRSNFSLSEEDRSQFSEWAKTEMTSLTSSLREAEIRDQLCNNLTETQPALDSARAFFCSLGAEEQFDEYIRPAFVEGDR